MVVAGTAGERVQSAAAILAQAAVLSGLHCIQKNDYPVTVGSGFSVSEVKLSPEPILYTGTDRPDAILVVSSDGLAKVDVSRPDALVVGDDTLTLPKHARRLPLRKELGATSAALGAIGAFVARTRLLDPTALEAAAQIVSARHAGAAAATLRAGAALDQQTK